MDGNVVNINKLKKLNLSRIDRIFKVLCIIRTHARMHVRTYSHILHIHIHT